MQTPHHDPIAYLCPCGYAVFVEGTPLIAWRLALARGFEHARTCPYRRVTVAVVKTGGGLFDTGTEA
jgi:molybdopterin biosynthesis enzyme